MTDGQVPDTRERIQAAALELFIAQGFEKTSLREIADRLGFTKAALYYHFPSKAELIRSIIEPVRYEVDALLEEREAAEVVDPREVFGAYFDLLAKYQPVWLAIMRDASGLAYVDMESWVVDWLERFQRLFVGKDASVAELVRVTVAIGGLARAVVYLGELPLDELRPAALDAASAALGLGTSEVVS